MNWVWKLGLPFFYFLTFPIARFFTLEEDSLSQIAYWKILLHPHLAGSTAVAAPKAGMILTLGPLYELVGSPTDPSLLLHSWQALFGALWVFAIAQIAERIGGRWAGIFAGAFAIALGTVSREVIQGSSFLYFGPLILLGCLQQNLFVLSLASLVRIEGAAALGALALSHLFKRQFREALTASLSFLVSLSVYLGMAYLVQGSWDRLDAGRAAGYSYNYTPTFGWLEIQMVFEKITHNKAFLVFLIPTVIAFWKRKAPVALYFLAAPLLILLLNRLFMTGAVRAHYFFYLAAACIAVGCGYLFSTRLTRRWMAYPLVLLLILLESDRRIKAPTLSAIPVQYAQSLELKNHPPIPKGTRLLLEDEVAAPLILLEPKFGSEIFSLQAFNIISETERREVLQSTDYIGVWLNPSNYNYVNYLPIESWRSDPFRVALQNIWNTGVSQEIYGRRLVLADRTADRLLISLR